MELKNTYKYHLVLGLIIVGMDLFRSYVTGGHERFFSNLQLGLLYKTTFYITFFSVYAINVGIICPRTLAKKNLIYFVLGQISLFFIFAGIRFFLEEIVVYSIGGFHNYSDSSRTFWYYIFDNSYYSLKIILFSTFIYLLFRFLENKNKIHELKLEHQKAELDALKTQLEPHFLFNTLNVFYSELAEKQPETAKGIHKLSELLRYLTYEAQKDYMPLTKELKFIKDYIYFYEKRFENNLFLNLSIKGEVKEQEIPSLVLVHFIENICKHGIINDSDNPAEISITVHSDSLELRTNNKVSNVKNYSSKGIGRENLKKRLELLFSNNFIFEHKETNNMFTSYLKIPIKNS
ncbi:His_kinase domain-containing protein [Tenacibaculum sp. 190130A14a]|uniref:His_kinase domain-containing protein n=1 Tax=Tenacibaculum polynesiense TaxID=3137857 RepID=A0ABM9P6W4_9FLAO